MEKNGDHLPRRVRGLVLRRLRAVLHREGARCRATSARRTRRPVEQRQGEVLLLPAVAYQAAAARATTTTHPEFIQPAIRRNEVMAFVKEGLRDLSISRTTFAWGVPVPDTPSHVVYVWLDALCNYYSATRRAAEAKRVLGRPDVADRPHDRQGDLALPRRLLAGVPHGRGLARCRRRSSRTAGGPSTARRCRRRSATSSIRSSWPNDIGVDAFRYFVLREMPLGADGDFSHERSSTRYNAELANDLGNLLNRTLGMVHKYARSCRRRRRADPFAVDGGRGADYAQGDGRVRAVQGARGDLGAGARGQRATSIEKAPWKPESTARRRSSATCSSSAASSRTCSSRSCRSGRVGDARAARRRRDDARGRRGAGAARSPCRRRTPLFPRIDDDRKKELLERWRPQEGGERRQRHGGSDAANDGRISFDEFGKVDLRVARDRRRRAGAEGQEAAQARSSTSATASSARWWPASPRPTRPTRSSARRSSSSPT